MSKILATNDDCNHVAKHYGFIFDSDNRTIQAHPMLSLEMKKQMFDEGFYIVQIDEYKYLFKEV